MVRRSLSKALSWALIPRLQTIRAEIGGYPKSDSVRLTVLRFSNGIASVLMGLTGGSVDTKAIEHTVPFLWVWS